MKIELAVIMFITISYFLFAFKDEAKLTEDLQKSSGMSNLNLKDIDLGAKIRVLSLFYLVII